MRLLVPWALLGMLVLSGVLTGPLFQVLFWSQLVFYAMGVTALCHSPDCRSQAASIAASFVLLNSAAWLAFWIWISGNSGKSWGKVSYEILPLEYSANW